MMLRSKQAVLWRLPSYRNITQLTRRLGWEQAGRRVPPGPPLPHLLFRVALVVSLGVFLNACDGPTRSFERVAGGPTVYLDQRSRTQKVEARDKVAQILSEGLETY